VDQPELLEPPELPKQGPNKQEDKLNSKIKDISKQCKELAKIKLKGRNWVEEMLQLQDQDQLAQPDQEVLVDHKDPEQQDHWVLEEVLD